MEFNELSPELKPGQREKFLNITCDQTLTHIKLEKTRDKDIRFKTYFLNEGVELTQRIRSMAVFLSGLAA